jgi:hypothetical protein
MDMMIFMYTRMPSTLSFFETEMEDDIDHEYWRRVSLREDIAENKILFEDVLEDVREDVAYRPTQEGFFRKLDTFYQLLL